jgi:formylglycine-generating enzyme required for sulfatase activity
MEEKMYLSKSNFRLYLFYFLAFISSLLACGTDETVFENKRRTTGAYHPTLIFPNDTPHNESITNVLTGFDCNDNHISTIEFTFIGNDSSHGPSKFPCQDHQAYIEDIPAGTDIRVDVYAYDENQAKALYGFEITDIIAGQVTEGGEIDMQPIEDNQPPSFTLDDLGMEFVRIPAGEFDMGSPLVEPGHGDDENLHRVRLTRAFYLQATEVTQIQWRVVVNAAADTTLHPSPSYFADCGDDCPVTAVSWNEVQLFIQALNERYQGEYEFRLPTEAQWEYAARAGSDEATYNGPITVTDCGFDPALDPIGWYCGNSDVNYDGCMDLRDREGPACTGTHPVAEKLPNAWGLFDMHGNVTEWCSDWYEETYSYTTEPVIDPQGPSSGTERVNRGGDWAMPAHYCRSAYRISWADPVIRYRSIGFRLVCSPLAN